MTPDRPVGGVALSHHRVTLPAPLKTDDSRLHPISTSTETATLATGRQGGSFAVLPPNASLSRTSPTTLGATKSAEASTTMQHNIHTNGDNASTQGYPQSSTESQNTTITMSTDAAFTPPASDTSTCAPGPSSQDSQLQQLSEIAATQNKMATDVWSSRKRMADGEVKNRSDSQSPVKSHSRNISTASRASTTGSYIGEVRYSDANTAQTASCLFQTLTNTLKLSAELRTRLSYAMVKVNHGWQSNSLDEVETLASQAASPTPSTSTVHRCHGSSASPRMPMSATPSASAPASYSTLQHRKSNSPPRPSASKPTLAPPAPIQPSTNMPAPQSNSRRNSNPHYTPTLLSHSHSASPHTPGQSSSQPGPKSRSMADPTLYSPHQNVREQDAMEALLFMSSPGNSANLKHAFSPTGSPAPNSVPVKMTQGRHALPSGPRKALPTQRQAQPNRRLGFEKPPAMPPPGSPMDLDSPQRPHVPNRAMPRRRINGNSSHHRGALSLPSGLGIGNGTARKVLRDEDIERMLDRAGEDADSSDDEEIQIPRGRDGVAGIMQA